MASLKLLFTSTEYHLPLYTFTKSINENRALVQHREYATHAITLKLAMEILEENRNNNTFVTVQFLEKLLRNYVSSFVIIANL